MIAISMTPLGFGGPGDALGARWISPADLIVAGTNTATAQGVRLSIQTRSADPDGLPSAKISL